MYITVEGIDGAGKSTLLEGLSRSLKSNVIKLEFSSISDTKEAFNNEKAFTSLIPFRELVLRDRGPLTTVVYETLNKNGNMYDYMKKADKLIKDIRLPDLIVYLYVEPEIAAFRKQYEDSILKLKDLLKLYDYFIPYFKEYTRVVRIDANRNQRVLVRETLKIINE